MAGRSTQLPTPRDVWNPDRYGKFRSERSAPFLDLLALVERVASAARRRPRLRPGRADAARARAPRRARDGRHRLLRRDAREGGRARRRRASPSGRGTSARSPSPASTSSSRTRRSTGCPTTRRSSRGSPRCSRPAASSRSRSPRTRRTRPTRSRARWRASRRSPARSAASCGRARCSSPRRTPRRSSGSGSRAQRVRFEVYAHRLASREDVVEWVRGTTLTDYEKRLDAPTWAQRSSTAYRERLMAALRDERPFLYTYRRRVPLGAALTARRAERGAPSYLKPPVIAKNP